MSNKVIRHGLPWIVVISSLVPTCHGQGFPDTLGLRVDVATGQAQIISNFFNVGVAFDRYQITSSGGSLNPTGWIGLQDQGFVTWRPTGSADNFFIGEQSETSRFIISPGMSVPMGTLFDTSVNALDVVFEYHDLLYPDELQLGYVEYSFPEILAGDFNEDGVVSHADYSVLADHFGQGFSVPDFAIYKAHYSTSAPPLPTNLPFSVVSTFEPVGGNNEWHIRLGGVKTNVGGHLNIRTTAPILSIVAGSEFQDDQSNPVGLPGLISPGAIANGIVINGNNAFVALGSTLSTVPKDPLGVGKNLEYIKLTTAGPQPTVLTFEGAIGYQGVDYSISSSRNTSIIVVLPDINDQGDFEFENVPSGQWFDPPLVPGFRYVMESNSLFTSILDFPPGFDQPFRVSVDGSTLGFFRAQQSVDFVTLLGHGVKEFVISGIAPSVDAANPQAFPLKLAFNTPFASFRMEAIPEPISNALMSLAGLFSVLAVRRRGSRAN